MQIENRIIRNFKLLEFPEDPRKYAEPQLIYNLDDLRDFLDASIFPSPVSGALARFDLGAKDSQHYAVNRKSTAIDIFCDCDPFEAFTKILFSSYFCRIGIYFDTFYNKRKRVMFHVDLKPQSLLWYRDKDGYYYSTQKDFYNKLFNKLSQEQFERYRG